VHPCLLIPDLPVVCRVPAAKEKAGRLSARKVDLGERLSFSCSPLLSSLLLLPFPPSVFVSRSSVLDERNEQTSCSRASQDRVVSSFFSRIPFFLFFQIFRRSPFLGNIPMPIVRFRPHAVSLRTGRCPPSFSASPLQFFGSWRLPLFGSPHSTSPPLTLREVSSSPS